MTIVRGFAAVIVGLFLLANISGPVDQRPKPFPRTPVPVLVTPIPCPRGVVELERGVTAGIDFSHCE